MSPLIGMFIAPKLKFDKRSTVARFKVINFHLTGPRAILVSSIVF